MSFALVFGVEFALTDKTRFADDVYSREQQLARGERAYSYLISPLRIIDWQINPDDGRYDWVKIAEPYSDSRLPTETQGEDRMRYRVWTREHWELYESTGKQDAFVAVAGDVHPVGEVPLATMTARRAIDSSDSIDSDSIVADVVYADRDLLNEMSLIRDTIYGQIFYQLFLPDDGTNQWAGVDVGVGVAIPYNSEHGQPMMVGPTSDLIRAQYELATSKAQLVSQLLGLGRGSRGVACSLQRGCWQT
jgi:hypothetical protein